MRWVSYRVAFLDWLACAEGGRAQPAAWAAQAAGDPVAALGAAGHVLDFDDTFLPGIAHLSAPVAPAALYVAAELGATVEDMLAAYAAGFEAMGALARASHPALYDRGFHPTAGCGSVGAAVAAARLLGTDEHTAVALAVLRAAGLRAAFGSDGKSLQVGLAASAGVTAARLAAHRATASHARGGAAWRAAYGGEWAEPDPAAPALAENWVKAWPCCLQTHGAIECAAALDEIPEGPLTGVAHPAPRPAAALDEIPEGPLTVIAHPVSRQAAGYDGVETPLQAKFSIPYTTAYTLLHGPPDVGTFTPLDAQAQALAERITVQTDAGLRESEFLLLAGHDVLAHTTAARGSPERPPGP